MRKIHRIIWHCSATRAGWDIGAKAIDQWHKAKGWRGIGYHYVVRRDGTIEQGRPEHQIGAHVRGHNSDSIGICYVGGLRGKDTRTDEQKAALYRLTSELLERYPGATVHGHNEFDRKACPGFQAGADWQSHLEQLKTEKERRDIEDRFHCSGCCQCKGEA